MSKQGTAAWFSERTGCLTASNMRAAMARLKNGNDGAERAALKVQVLAERLTGDVVPHYVTPAMQHGLDTEPAARSVYSASAGEIIEECGFIRHPSIEYFGASPDGRINPKLGLELKCPTTAKFLSWRLAGVVPDEHKPQMIAQCVCAGFDAVEFVAFDPRLPKHLQMFVVRYTPTQEERDAVEQAARDFLQEVDSMFNKLTETEPA
jgi:hypothetical protein